MSAVSASLDRGRPRPPRRRQSEALDMRKLFAFIFMVFGMFMAILDIQIVSASLSEIQAGLSASSDEVTWVQTAYLVAEVIMIPLSGFLSRAFSTRYVFVASAAGFTLMSFFCASASSINEMIFWRALQGFIGGGMIPTVFASAYTIFPRSKQPIVAPIIGLVATLAPTIGPTVGGYLTDAFSWHWLFLVNIIPGHHRLDRMLVPDRFRRARPVAAQAIRLGRARGHGGVSRRARICARRRPVKGLVRERAGDDGDRRFGVRRDVVLLARLSRASADRRSQRFQGSQFLDRLAVLFRAWASGSTA